ETDTITLQNPSARDGYIFKGWEDDSGQTVTEITKGSTGHKVFTATWRHYTITYIISDGDIKGADWKGDKLEYTENDVITLPTVSNPNLTFKGWKIRSNGGAAAGVIYSDQIAAGTLTGDIELVPYYVVTVTFEPYDGQLDIHNVLDIPEDVNYLEFEITDTLADLPIRSDTGEYVFYYKDEQDEPKPITEPYEEFVFKKNITLWVKEVSGGTPPEKV
ncbi:MAG: InlB B-repeat-containing protein, partial [Candidatus Enterosoma sp.]|nr:InlB B-repeat-containing protein [bacterium]MDY5866143.1 InlB B-repeat-containing protein [Candidatus Enterosoma sp.]